VSPHQDLAVLVSTDGSTHWYSLSGNAATEITAQGSMATPTTVVFSPTGAAAALVAGRSVQVVTGLPGSPTLAGSATLEGGVPRGTSGRGWLAVSDDGAWLLVAWGNGLRLVALGGGSSTLMPIGRSAAVAFSPGSHDAAVVSDGALTWIHNAAGGAGQQVIGRNSALARPVGVAFSSDGAALFAADAAGLVLGYDLAGGASAEQSSGAAATALEPMGGFFRLNEAGSGPLWLVDPNAGSPKVFFVPAAVTSN
jgi:sugar lactone lactonase YvrE